MSGYISEQIEWDKNSTAPRVFGGPISGSAMKLAIGTTGSLELANPKATTLSLLFPNATTGSLYMVGSGAQTFLAFKDIQGTWRTVTASFAA